MVTYTNTERNVEGIHMKEMWEKYGFYVGNILKLSCEQSLVQKSIVCAVFFS